MRDDAVYAVWYASALGTAHSKIHAVLRTFRTFRAFFEAGAEGRREFGLLTPKERNSLDGTPIESAWRVLDRCREAGIEIRTADAPDYPLRLLRIPNPPAALYVRGDLPDIDNEPVIGVVGTRSATAHGHAAAFRLSFQMAKAGAVIVSGGAVGIDSDAHGGALRAGGRTVAVLGCGIEYPYLTRNRDLRELIARNGALVSEFEPDCPPTRFSFPIRNRIISALSLGVVIVEAGIKSGSLITASHALEQGKDVFAVTGGVMSPAYAGTNRLLRDGAVPVFSAYDVLREYASIFPDKLDMRGTDLPLSRLPSGPREESPKAQTRVAAPAQSKREPPKSEPGTSSNVPEDLSDTAKKVLAAFRTDVMNTDELCAETGLAPPELLRVLTELELRDLVVAKGGSRFQKSEN